MTKKILTYEDLLEEKVRLKALVKVQREIVRQDIREIKEEFAPVKKAIHVVGKFFTHDKNNWLLTTAADKAIDLVFRKLILARAGWITKLAVPYLMKNFSSHLIADNKDGILSKILGFLGKKHKNGKMPEPVPEEEE